MPVPPPLGDGERAALHVTENTRTYPCRACGGQLVFDPRQGRLRCASCGNTAEVVGGAGTIAKHDLRQATAALRAAAMPVTLEKEVVCQACGGHTRFTGTLTATRCPYCATPVQRDDLRNTPSRLPIDGVLPFRVDEKSARENIEKWINSRWFTPTEFKSYREIGSFESIYLAYFSYDAHVTADYTGRRGEDHQVTVRDGDQERTETRTRWYPASGRVRQSFNDVAAWANNGLDEKRVHKLEPWPLHESVPYSPEYVAGHLGRTYDLDADETFGTRVRGSLEQQVETTIRHDIGGDRQEVHHRDIRFDVIAFAHLLLPVWLLTVTYEGKPYQVLMNGVTGEVQGERPWSRIKLALFIGGIVLVIAVIAIIVAMLR
jgi:Zn finger protein HypA/HybF involved in hydrogenase expression